MERFYRFAGITFKICGSDDDMYQDDGVLAPFRIEGSDYDHRVHYKPVDSFSVEGGVCIFKGSRLQVFRDGQAQITFFGDTHLLPEGAHTRICREKEHCIVQVLRQEIPDRIMPRFVLNTLEMEHHIACNDGFLLHASFIDFGGSSILFTAPSGTGKSTQALLWQQYRGAQIMNGDRVAVTVGADGVMAHGIPYCGTSGICRNVKLPVSAIVYLTQAPHTEVSLLQGLQAFKRVWEGCSINVWDKEDVERCTNTVMETIQRVPVLHLSCTPDETAVNMLEEFLIERR